MADAFGDVAVDVLLERRIVLLNLLQSRNLPYFDVVKQIIESINLPAILLFLSQGYYNMFFCELLGELPFLSGLEIMFLQTIQKFIF